MIVVLGLKLPVAQAQNISINTAMDCDSNAVIWCGAGSVNQLIGKYRGGDGRNSADSIHNIFNFFGISAADINSMNTDAVKVEAGQVSKAGNVFDGSGTVVATDAITGGRDNIAGSTRVTSNGTVFFTRPPSVSFASDRLSAYVVTVNGKFSFAILASCGNAVKATPKVTPPAPTPPKPQPAPPTPAPTPPAPTPPPATTSICSGNTTNTSSNNSGGTAQGGNCSTNIVNNAPAPAAAGAAQCTNLLLTVNPADPRTVTAAISLQLPNDTQLQSVNFDFGDGTAPSITSQTTVTHTFQQTGTFIVKATPTFSGTATTASVNCQATVTIAMTTPICSALGISEGDNRTAIINNFQTTATGGTLTSADINWGDGTTVTGVTNLIGQTHQYQTDGPFTVSITAHFMVNGQDVVATGTACQQQLSFAAPAAAPPAAPPPPATQSSAPPPTPVAATPAPQTPPTSLVNTGPGNVAGIFGITTIIGTLGYRQWLRRYLARL
jgi:PKD domain